jgi:hypothetical protein
MVFIDGVQEPIGTYDMKTTALFATALAVAFASVPVLPASAQEDAKIVIATQVRAQQHPCGTPEKAVRDEALSKPDAAVWILTCDNATYQVRLHPGMAADIKKLE